MVLGHIISPYQAVEKSKARLPASPSRPEKERCVIIKIFCCRDHHRYVVTKMFRTFGLPKRRPALAHAEALRKPSRRLVDEDPLCRTRRWFQWTGRFQWTGSGPLTSARTGFAGPRGVGREDPST